MKAGEAQAEDYYVPTLEIVRPFRVTVHRTIRYILNQPLGTTMCQRASNRLRLALQNANAVMSMRVNFSPTFLATHDAEPARLVLTDERIVAILVPISPEDDINKAGGWYLQVGFGPCDTEGLLFPNLTAAEAWVREKLSGNSTFDAGLDRALVDCLRPPQPQETGPASACSLRLLIVEDDGLQALELEDQMQKLGHQVVDMVASGPAAVAAAEKYRPDLVLMDIRLAEGSSGMDAAAEIQQRLGILSIFMTAHSDAHTRLRLQHVRSLELLSKPVSPAAIEAALLRAVQVSRPH